MFIKSIFKDWTPTGLKKYLLSDVKYLRTFSIDEFKEVFHRDVIYVRKHPSGVLFFEANWDDWGLVKFNTIPDNPVISIACERSGNLFFVMHRQNDYRRGIYICSRAAEISMPDSSQREWEKWEEDKYIRDSYVDAFEGDPDAYWNID